MKCSRIDKSIEMGSGCLGDESGVDRQGMTDNRYRVSLCVCVWGGNENILNLDAVMVVQLHQYAKIH